MLANSFGSSINEDNYVSGFNAYGLGASYTWFPGLTSNIDGVMFDQKDRGVAESVNATDARDDGYVILVSQKMTF
jgi:hypothetical protein